jgi:hypothetical protein
MELTEENLDAYLKGEGGPDGAHAAPFSVRNVFTGSPESHNEHDLAWRDYPVSLNGRGGGDLLCWDIIPNAPHGYRMVVDHCDPGHGQGSDPSVKVMHSIPASSSAEPADPYWLDYLALHTQHNHDVGQLCDLIGQRWETAHALYNGDMQPQGDKYRESLYLIPTCQLPSQQLMQKLVKERRTHHLLLLTARHELGHFCLLVEQWWDATQEARRTLGVLPDGVDKAERGRLVARARLQEHATTGPAQNGRMDLRTDLPQREFQPDSDLQELYKLALDWYEQEVFLLAAQIRVCGNEGCRKALPEHKERGRPIVYCSAACADDGRRKQNARYAKAYRDEKKRKRERADAARRERRQTRA